MCDLRQVPAVRCFVRPCLVFCFTSNLNLFSVITLVISISSAALSRGAKWSVFALYRGHGFVPLAGRGAAWKTGDSVSDRDGVPL